MLHPSDYIKICNEQEEIIQTARKVMSDAYDKAVHYPLPTNLRPATPSDIVIGAVLWYHNYWSVVEEVLRPNDDFKAYLYNGGRYGLHGAFIET